jgi:hypothetical protein
MRYCAALLLVAVIGCERRPLETTGPSDAAVAAAVTQRDSGGGLDAPLVLPAVCASDTELPPVNLVCTGLYADIANKVVAPGIEVYAPAVPLWSDGAQKQRWIRLPSATVIDNSNPVEWKFPVGTQVWKEFSKDGQRVETRLWQKVTATYWVDATYLWNSDESAAVQSKGGDIPFGDGGTYHVPTQDECEDCHRGAVDNILGFDQVLLGLAGATGLTLTTLVAENRLSDPPASTNLSIGDDGTGAAAPALGWLHVNCGRTCHNDNSNAEGYAAGMLLRLDPTELDGRPVNGFDPLKTTIGVVATTPAWSGQTRIDPGSLDRSLLYQLISHRGSNVQMPPIATSLVDETDDALVAAWISRMPQLARDAGEDAAMDAAGQSTMPDGGARTLDSGVDAVSAGDARPGLADAGAPPSDAGRYAADAGLDAAGVGTRMADAGSAEVMANDAAAKGVNSTDGAATDGHGAQDGGRPDASTAF